MPPGPDRTDDIVRALQNRHQRAVILNLQKKFALFKALEAVQQHRGDIRRPSDLDREKKSKQIGPEAYKLIEDIFSGVATIDAPLPTPSQAQRATQRGQPAEYQPRINSGAYAILLVLHQEKRDLNKDEIVKIADENGWCNQGLNEMDAQGKVSAHPACAA